MKPFPKRGLAATSWMVVPLVVVMAAGFNLPLVAMLGESVFTKGGLSLQGYLTILESSVYVKVLGNTFKIALISTVLCAFLGYLLAYWMRGLSKKWQSIVLAAIIVPFWISILVRTYAWIVVLGNSGVVNRTLDALGWVSSPVAFLYNELGVTIGMVNVLLPFLVLPLYAAMNKIDGRLLRAAETLGATRQDVFWRVFFPLSAPALAAGSILVFILALGFYITPAILGGGRVPMIANMLDLLINQMPNWQLASSISALLLVLTLILFAFYLRFAQQEQRP